ncbi:hypothetical protein AYO41_00975 [Verrucomicrobia bacterium SCGC AG-212-E04]|nr:hypothetical protein AYO41_00975 [Verrucomicrobia bacterium SCGC AG-212-E04]
MKTPKIVFSENPREVDWAGLKGTLTEDDFDNGRSADELRESFVNSRHVCFAYIGGKLVGTGRLLSDGVANAYLVDVWVLSKHRRRGIGARIVSRLLDAVPGQHVFLQADDIRLYRRLGFRPQPVGMSLVAGLPRPSL